MKKTTITMLSLLLSASYTYASSTGSNSSAPCYVNGKIVSMHMQVNMCQSKLKGDPLKKNSYKNKKQTKQPVAS